MNHSKILIKLFLFQVPFRHRSFWVFDNNHLSNNSSDSGIFEQKIEAVQQRSNGCSFKMLQMEFLALRKIFQIY